MNGKRRVVGSLWLLASAGSLGVLGGCSGVADGGEVESTDVVSSELLPGPAHLRAAEARGRETWLESTFGGEKFFSLMLPQPPFNLTLGFSEVFRTPRSARFDEWGVINDPDCEQGDASTGGFDACADPNATGVVGIRKFPNPLGGAPLVGVSCASCHAGLDPTNPPADPNAPGWDNIHLTIGNQHLEIGKIFKALLPESDPRWQVFNSWAPGTVDTTVLESDHINNPGVITPIFDVPLRPFFDQTLEGEPIRVHRSGQGGEDDAGCERAALRVYFNIGMCAAECMVGHLANGPGGSQTEIDLTQCRADCQEFRDAEAAAGDLCAFLNTPRAPRLLSARGGVRAVDWAVAARGARVFAAECASCHARDERPFLALLSDDEVHPVSEIGTNSCRALTTNWMEGQIWGQFSSDQYKARSTGGPGFYRDMPLDGIWATAPFLHNNRLGEYTGDASLEGRLLAFESAMEQLLNPELRDLAGSVQRTTQPITVGSPSAPVTLPAGTPVALFANTDPAHPGVNLCPDLVENKGHTFGSALSPADKRALTEFLKTQ